jgi:hypothetical protein
VHAAGQQESAAASFPLDNVHNGVACSLPLQGRRQALMATLLP